MAAIALHQAADADNWLGGAGSCLITVVLLADAVHFAPQARVWGCWSAAERICEIEVVLPLSPVAGRITEPRRDRATASVSPPQSRPTESTTMSGRLPVLSPSARRIVYRPTGEAKKPAGASRGGRWASICRVCKSGFRAPSTP